MKFIELVKERMSKYEDALWSGVATIHAQTDGIDYLEWRAFSEALSINERHSGINGIGIIHYIVPANLENYIAKQKLTRPDFEVHPPHQQQEYWPITFIEPINTNKKALGLDMAHESNRLTAARKARDTGTAQITGPITLVQDAKKTPGFLLYVPYYNQVSPASDLDERQQRFVGIVYAPFIMKKLMEGTLQNKNRLVNFSIMDGGETLYDELHHDSEDYDSSPLYSKQTSVEMYGRKWSFEVQSSDLFRQQQTSRQPLIILIGGIVIDSLLLGLFLVLARSNKKAINVANLVTKELKESEALLDTAVQSSSAGFAIVDRDGCFVEINHALCRWLGFETGELIGKNSIEIISAQDKALSQLMIDNMFSGEMDSTQAERQYLHKDGSVIWGLLSAAVVKDSDGRANNIVYHIADIQNEKELLANLLRQNKELEKSNADLEQFAYIASHDLKSPLNAIQQLANWIEEDCREILPNASIEHLKLLRARSNRMSQLLEDLLNYSKVARYDYDVEPLNLKSLVDDQYNLIDTKTNFTCTSPNAKLLVPKIPLEIVVRNLLSNAIKHHDKDRGNIVISFKQEDQSNIITITDDGPGIPPNMQKKVLDMFQTLKPRDDVEGSGMGLAMVDRIIAHYKGELIINSDGIRGTEFVIIWPVTEQMGVNKESELDSLLVAGA